MLSPERDTRGILRPGAGFRSFDLLRLPPVPALEPYVDWCWVVSWDLDPGTVHDQEVVALVAVNLSFRSLDGAGLVNGVQRSRQVRHLEGRGRVVAAKFRPAGFRPFVGVPMARLTDRILPVTELFGPDGHEAERSIAAAGDAAAAVDELQAFLLDRSPRPDPLTEVLNDAVASVGDDPTITRVDQLAERVGVGARHLQRLFADHVGVSPKWAIRRARIQDAAERVKRGESVRWADVAAELGWADQAHLTRAFTKAVGQPPETYARSCAADRAMR